MESKKKKGMVVVVCAPSQRGKDLVISKIMEKLIICFEDRKLCEPAKIDKFGDRVNEISRYATVYKTRPKRKNDPDHVMAIQKVEDCPIPVEDQMGYTIYGTQHVIYSRKEIQEGIDNGEIIFISTGDPDFAREIKREFGNSSFSVVIQGHYKDKDSMIKEEVKRAGGVDIADMDKVNAAVDKRIKDREEEANKLQEFLQDCVWGPDMLIRNTYTIFNEEWCSHFTETTHGDIFWVAEAIALAVKFNRESDNGNYREVVNILLTDEERKEININSLLDYYWKYRERKTEFIL